MAQTTRDATSRHRIEVRVSPDQEALIREAAELAHETVTAFMLTTATERASRLVEAQRTVTLSNEGLGARLLAEALRMALVSGDAVAARLIVVDAIDERAAQFYRQHGFTAPLGDALRLYRRMKEVRVSMQPAEHRANP